MYEICSKYESNYEYRLILKTFSYELIKDPTCYVFFNSQFELGLSASVMISLLALK